MKDIRLMCGDSLEAQSHADVMNNIISIINRSGNRKPTATLYLGKLQRKVMMQIASTDPVSPRDFGDKKEFYGWPIIWVDEDFYVKLAI